MNALSSSYIDTQISSQRVRCSKICSFNGLSAAIISGLVDTDPCQVIFFSTPGNYSIINLPKFFNGSAQFFTCELDATSLYVFAIGYDNLARLLEYKLERKDSELPVSLSLIVSEFMGDKLSRNPSLLRLKSGKIVAVVSQHSYSKELYIKSKDPGQISWIDHGKLFLCPPVVGSHETKTLAIVQHPEGQVMIFMGEDGSHTISLTILNENLELIKYLNEFLNGHSVNGISVCGEAEPNGEIPTIAATQDLVRNQVLILYTNAQWKWTNEQNKVLISPLVLVAVNSSGGWRSMGVTPDWMEHNSTAIDLKIKKSGVFITFPLWRVGLTPELRQIIYTDGIFKPSTVIPSPNTEDWGDPPSSYLMKYPDLSCHLLQAVIPQQTNSLTLGGEIETALASLKEPDAITVCKLLGKAVNVFLTKQAP